MPDSSLKIAIAGAGIGGLVAALALQRQGFRPTIFEQASQLREVGAGLTLAPNATRVLLDLGLGPKLTPAATRPEWQVVQHYQSASELVRVQRGQHTQDQYGAPYWQFHRADLQAVLLQAVLESGDDCLHTGRRLSAFREQADNVQLEFEDGSQANCELLIGCDGVKSIVRSTLFAEPAPRYTGFVAWRGLVPAERLSPAALSPEAGLFIGPDRMLARYRIRDDQLVNYAAYARSEQWEPEGWMVPAAVDEVMAAFEQFHPVAREILAMTPPQECFKWGLFSRPPLPTWSKGRITLLGDAAHPTLPFLGQGANLAIEDGLVLSRALAACADPVQGLQRYASARAGRGQFVMQKSLLAVERYFSPDPAEFDETRTINEENLGLFSYDAATAAI